MKRMLLFLLLAASCGSDPVAPNGPVLNGADEWRVAEYRDGQHVNTWYCDAYEIKDSGALICYLSAGGLRSFAAGSFVLTPFP